MDCAKQNGHTTHYISCKGRRKYCYQKLVNQRHFECQYCTAKNRFTAKKSDYHTAIELEKNVKTKESQVSVNFNPSVISSVGSALRKERDDWVDFVSINEKNLLIHTEQDFNKLTKEFLKVFSQENFDFLFIFNGRFHDVAAAIKAAKQLNIPFATHERAWFGRGMQINLNSDCLSLKHGHYKKLRCSDGDLETAKELITKRINNGIKGEWKGYNQSRRSFDINLVPNNYKGKYLVIPSSRSEFLGHSDFELTFKNSLATLDNFLNFYDINSQDVIVRGHPAWVSKIGNMKVSESLEEYRAWCDKNGATFIEPDDVSISTYELMLVSKLGIFNGGSAVIEATHLGLPCVLLSKSQYANANFITNLSVSKDLWPASLPDKIEELDLQDVYKYVYFRFRHQVAFFNNVIATGPTSYALNINGACLREFEDLISMGKKGIFSDAAYNAQREIE